MSTKEKIHKLVDQIKDEELLKGYLLLLESSAGAKAGKLWNSLSVEEKKDLLLSYEESFDDNQLVDEDKVKNKLKKWL